MTLVLSGVGPIVAGTLIRTGLDKLIGEENIHNHINGALKHAGRLIDSQAKAEVRNP